MTAAGVDDPEFPVMTRPRMLAVAMRLFSRYSFAGTSLQMIADELDLTKAAIYYHFRTRDDLLLALMQPMLREMGDVVEAAERLRGARRRAEAMLLGYADIVARNRMLTSVTVSDPSVRRVLSGQPEWSALIDRQLALMTGSGPAPSTSIDAAVVMIGLGGAAAMAAATGLPDDVLCDQLVDAGRRVLGLVNPTT